MPLRLAASIPGTDEQQTTTFYPFANPKNVNFGVSGQNGQIRVHWWIVIGVPQFAMNFAVPSCGFASPSTELLPYNRYCRYSIPFRYQKFPSFTRFGRSSVVFCWVALLVVRSQEWILASFFHPKFFLLEPSGRLFPTLSTSFHLLPIYFLGLARLKFGV